MGKLISILKLLPVLLAAIQAVEQAIKGPGKGSSKLDLVLGITQDVFETTPDLQKDFKWESLAVIVPKVVGRIVGTFNKTGVFEGKAAPTPG
jgi:hypothetical protein